MPKYIWLLAVSITINVIGASFLWPLNTIYMHNELGKSLAFAGFILMLNQGATIIGNLVGGALFDRYSAYKTILYSSGLSVIAAVFLSFNHSILPYSIMLILIGFGSGATWPVMFAMAGSVWPKGGRRAFNAMYVAQNLGVALGATFGGYVASISFTYIFIANAAFFMLFFLIVLFTFEGMDQERNRQMYTTVFEQKKKIEDKKAFRSLLVLSIGFFVVWLAYSQWGSTIASHTQDIGIPLEQYSTLWAINGLLIVAGQPFIKMIKWQAQKTYIYIGNIIFLLSFIIAMVSETFFMFALAMVILTIGEMLVWPAIPTVANDLAPPGRAGFYQGFINSVAAAGRMVGPVVGGLLVDHFSIHLLFITLIILLFIPFITTVLFDRGLKVEESS